MCRNSEITKSLFFCTAILMLIVAAGSVQAEPTMDIQSSHSTSDYDEFDPNPHPGNELLISYLVSNDSALFQNNNMINFTLPAGSNNGVYVAAAPPGWGITINSDYTLFEGNGSIIAPGSTGLFELYSTDLNIHQDYATAMSLGDGVNVPFTPVQTDVPGEYPHTLSADIYFDGIVNLLDFAVLAGEWMDEEDWYGPPYTGDDGTTMDIQIARAEADYWLENPGLESLWQYSVTNTSDFGSHNNMINFTLPAGSNQGVFWAEVPYYPGWLIVINPDKTVFTGNGNYIAPGDQELFELYSTDLNIHQDYATATAVGDEVPVPFTPVQTDVPGEYERTLSADITGNGIVDANDLKQMSDEWLITESWYVP